MQNLKQPIKILQVINCLKPGGAENIAKTLALNSRNKITFLVLYKKLNNNYEKELSKKGIKIYSLDGGKFFNFKTQIKIFRIIKKINPDIIHTHLDGLVYIFLPAKFLRRKIIHTIHSEFENRADVRKRIINFLAFHTRVTAVGVSNNIKRKTERTYGLKNIAQVNNGIIKNAHGIVNKSKIRKKYHLPERKKILINVGNLKPVKNQPELIKIFSKLLKTRDDLFLLIVGDGELKDDLLKTADSLKLSRRNFKIISDCDNPARLLAASDYFVLTSKSEGLPLVILEAMAAKLPIITTPAGGIAEIIFQKKNGFIINEVNSREILRALDFYSNRKTRLNITKTAFKDFQDKFDAKKMIQAYNLLYSKLKKPL